MGFRVKNQLFQEKNTLSAHSEWKGISLQFFKFTNTVLSKCEKFVNSYTEIVGKPTQKKR